MKLTLEKITKPCKFSLDCISKIMKDCDRQEKCIVYKFYVKYGVKYEHDKN